MEKFIQSLRFRFFSFIYKIVLFSFFLSLFSTHFSVFLGEMIVVPIRSDRCDGKEAHELSSRTWPTAGATHSVSMCQHFLHGREIVQG